MKLYRGLDRRAAATGLLLHFRYRQFKVSVIVRKRRRTLVGGVDECAADGLMRDAIGNSAAYSTAGFVIRRLGLGIGSEPTEDAQDRSDRD